MRGGNRYRAPAQQSACAVPPRTSLDAAIYFLVGKVWGASTRSPVQHAGLEIQGEAVFAVQVPLYRQARGDHFRRQN